MERHDPVIRVSRRHQSGRVSDTFTHIMQGRILIHELEMIRMFLSISKLCRPETTNREFMETKHICHRHKAKGCPVQLRTLGHTCPDKQSTITTTHNCQSLRSS